ncbi:MAG: MBOAT family O-acyltransferase [Bacteroidia bacterium]
MVFSSITFLLFFFPAFLLIYQFIDKQYKNAFILCASILFYAWGAPKFIVILLATTTLDFYLVKALDNSTTERNRKLFLVASLLMNLGLLAYFKYANFFIENVNAALSVAGITNVTWTKIILPIGISFYTFETVTYVVDVYRKVHKPLRNFWDYQLYIILFPKLIAGPIVRFHSIADQITQRNETIDDKLHGFTRFCVGLAKKILIANVLGAEADAIMNQSPETLTTASAWVGIMAYTFQIYFDFSGYSDMALGIGKMIGFTFPENFNNPYNATSITEFWRRWHISLGAWMKNYLYIPLGGNKVDTQWRLFFNLWFVFLVSGLWHGASWNFVIWGAFHGFFLIMDKAFLLKFLTKIGKLPSVLFTFIIVMIGWVFFRIEGLAQALHYIKQLFAFNFDTSNLSTSLEFKCTLVVAIVISFIHLFKIGEKLQAFVYNGANTLKWYVPALLISFVLYTLSVGAITTATFNPFIYFRF